MSLIGYRSVANMHAKVTTNQRHCLDVELPRGGGGGGGGVGTVCSGLNG